MSCDGIIMTPPFPPPTVAARASRRVGDRDWVLFGLVGVERVPPEGLGIGLRTMSALVGGTLPIGDRDSVNSARPARTRFYSARSTHVGSTAMSGDCEEMNPTAASARPADAGRQKRFRPDVSGHHPPPQGVRTMHDP